MADALSREELRARYGQPRRLADDLEGQVLVFGHDSREAADAYAAANTEHRGHPTSVEQRDTWIGWVTVVDLRPAIAALDVDRRR